MDTNVVFKAFFEYSPDAVIAIRDDGTIMAASKKALNLFGYQADELKGQLLEVLMPAQYHEIHRQHREDFAQDPQNREMGKGFDLLAQRKDNSTFFAEVSISPMHVENQHITLASIRNVTEKKELYNQLRISNDQFKGAFEYSSIGMALISKEGRWLKVNKSVCDIVGYSEKELLAKTFQDITHPDDLDLDLEHVGKMLRGEIESYHMEKRYFHKNGHVVWVLLSVSLAKDPEGQPVHFVSQIKNITERKMAEKALRESEERWQFALEGAGEGVWDWNAKTNKVFFSRQWKRLLGFDEHEIGDELSEWDSRVHPDDKEQCYKDLGSHMQGETEVYLNEHRLLCKDGKYKWILDRGKVIEWDAERKPLRVIGTHSDITPLKIKEKELQETVELVNEQNARLMNFAHIVSHNLRSHTGNFQLLVDLLDRETDEAERLQMIKFLKENSQSLNETIKHLNDVVQININTSIVRENLKLKEYVNKVADVVRAEMNQLNATVLNNIADDVFVHFNPAYLESVFLNFLSNGLKYRHAERQPKIVFEMKEANGKKYLAITDNGVGINLKKYKEKLFGLYKTFHGNNDARGVGLFITKNQVEAMGGKIEVESTLNEGTTFKIFFK